MAPRRRAPAERYGETAWTHEMSWGRHGAANDRQLASRLRKKRALRRVEDQMLQTGGRSGVVAAAAKGARPLQLTLGGLGGAGMVADDALPEGNRAGVIVERAV